MHRKYDGNAAERNSVIETRLKRHKKYDGNAAERTSVIETRLGGAKSMTERLNKKKPS